MSAKDGLKIEVRVEGVCRREEDLVRLRNEVRRRSPMRLIEYSDSEVRGS